MASLRSCGTLGFSASYTAARIAAMQTHPMARRTMKPLRQTPEARSITTTAGASVSVVPRSGSDKMRIAGNPAKKAARRNPVNPKCPLNFSSAQPKSAERNAMTQIFETSLGWKNQSHLLPPNCSVPNMRTSTRKKRAIRYAGAEKYVSTVL